MMCVAVKLRPFEAWFMFSKVSVNSAKGERGRFVGKLPSASLIPNWGYVPYLTPSRNSPDMIEVV